jgi:dTMP kinase
VTCLVAIEGADGAGKATASENVRAALVSRGLSATVISFPRYKDTVGGVTLGEFLSGRLPVPVTPKAAAVLYGLDRLESVPFIRETVATHDVVIFDRYIASNMVYQASKVGADDAADLMRWIYRLETEAFEVPAADLSIYLDTPLDAARRLMQLKDARSYTDRQFDEHEADTSLQRAVRRNYTSVAGLGLAGPWRIVATTVAGRLRQPGEIAAEIVHHVLATFSAGAERDSERTIASRA